MRKIKVEIKGEESRRIKESWFWNYLLVREEKKLIMLG